MVGAVSGPDAGRAGVVPRPQARTHLQQLLLNRLQSTSSLVTTVTLVCYTLSSTASYLYCTEATYPWLTWLLAWVLAWVLMEMMLARLCCTATTSEFCLLLAGLSPPTTV